MPADPHANLPVHRWPLPYEDLLDPRQREQIDLVVIHCTELPDLAMAREYGERVLYPKKVDGSVASGILPGATLARPCAAGAGNSGHFYIDRDGSAHEFVRPERIAHHVRGFNPRSVGIELVNTGRYPHWLDSRHQSMDEPYTEAQIAALIALLDTLRSQLPNLRWIAGHEDLDTAQVAASDDASIAVPRKRDPGPLFPWERVLAATPLQRMPSAPGGRA